MKHNSAAVYRIEKDYEIQRLPWISLRRALWPHVSENDHAKEMAKIVSQPSDNAAFLGYLPSGKCVAFAEAALRYDYVNGCESSPVAFLEGIFVAPDYRRSGLSRVLCTAIEDWAVLRGCTELASDADLTNISSHQMHRALGFSETERVVYFRKALTRKS